MPQGGKPVLTWAAFGNRFVGGDYCIICELNLPKTRRAVNMRILAMPKSVPTLANPWRLKY